MRTSRVLALTLASALAFAACGGDDDDTSEPASTDETTEAPDTTAAADGMTVETFVDAEEVVTESVAWEFGGESWRAMGEAPDCPDPIVLAPPADLSAASHVLYPGQVRGGDYKPHGGFLFQGLANDAVAVSTPLDTTLYRGSRYIEQGEVQYMFDFIHSCGLMIRLDHLLTLTPEFQAYADQLPEPQVDDSRTTPLPNDAIPAGTQVATAAGFVESANAFFDFGVYDLRAPNTAWEDPAYQSQYQSEHEQAAYSVCWFDWLSAESAEIVHSLPPGDPESGATSDYCA